MESLSVRPMAPNPNPFPNGCKNYLVHNLHWHCYEYIRDLELSTSRNTAHVASLDPCKSLIHGILKPLKHWSSAISAGTSTRHPVLLLRRTIDWCINVGLHVYHVEAKVCSSYIEFSSYGMLSRPVSVNRYSFPKNFDREVFVAILYCNVSH